MEMSSPFFYREELMKIKNRNRCIALCVMFVLVAILGCGNKEEKSKDTASNEKATSPDSISGQNGENTKDVLVSVDGKYLKNLTRLSTLNS